MMTRTALLPLCLALGLCACSSNTLVVPQSATSIHLYHQGQVAMERGRYLLARQYFSEAQAASRDGEMTERCILAKAAADRLVHEER